jgi:chromosomal replication initiation ATPase DnaA
MTASRQLALALDNRPALGREDFLVAPCNADAVAWIDRWPDWPAPALVLVGPPAAGKSHLAEVWRARSNAVLLDAARLDDAPARALGGADACVVEHIDRAGDDVALLMLYHHLAERGGHMLASAQQPPARWGDRLPDLVSRLAAAPTAMIAAPDDALIAGVLAKLFHDRQLAVAPGVIAYMVARMERSLAAARRLVVRLDDESLARRRRITVPLVRDVLAAPALSRRAGPP